MANWFPAGLFNHLHCLKGKENLRFLEIGVLEGRGTIFFFENFLGQTGTLVGVDPFIEYSKATVAKIVGYDHIINSSTKDRFLSNVAPYADRITLHQGLSQNVLPTLPSETFDLAFVDGDHSRDAVAIDARECWRLIKNGGFVVFDDYQWTVHGRREMGPKEAIDDFLKAHEDEVDIVLRQDHVVVRKTSGGVKHHYTPAS